MAKTKRASMHENDYFSTAWIEDLAPSSGFQRGFWILKSWLSASIIRRDICIYLLLGAIAIGATFLESRASWPRGRAGDYVTCIIVGLVCFPTMIVSLIKAIRTAPREDDCPLTTSLLLTPYDISRSILSSQRSTLHFIRAMACLLIPVVVGIVAEQLISDGVTLQTPAVEQNQP